LHVRHKTSKLLTFTVGPYRWLRHPVYAGLIVSYLGIALAVGTWLGGAVTLGSTLAVTVHRIGWKSSDSLRPSAMSTGRI